MMTRAEGAINLQQLHRGEIRIAEHFPGKRTLPLSPSFFASLSLFHPLCIDPAHTKTEFRMRCNQFGKEIAGKWPKLRGS